MSNVSFNLAAFMKIAMPAHGTTPQHYRQDQYKWFPLQEILSGQNTEWNSFVNINPSLDTVKNNCNAFYLRRISDFERRYGLPKEQIDNFFKVFIGYSPRWGAYMCSIGPFYSKVKAETDRTNRFYFGSHRYQLANSETIDASYSEYVNTKLASYRDILGMGDFSLTLINSGEPNEEGITEKQKNVFPSLDSAQARALFGRQNEETGDFRAPIMAPGSGLELNANGKYKVLLATVERTGTQQRLEDCIQAVATDEQTTPDIIRSGMANGTVSNQTRPGKQPDIPSKIIDRVCEKYDQYAIDNIQNEARNGGWEDALNQAIDASLYAFTTTKKGNAKIPTLTRQNFLDYLNSTTSGITPQIEGRDTSGWQAKKLRGDFLKELVGQINKISKDWRTISVKESDPEEVKAEKERKRSVATMMTVPVMETLGYETSGQQRETELSTPKSYERLLNLKKEILQKFIDWERLHPGQPINTEEIAQQMSDVRTNRRTKATAIWSAEDINFWVEELQHQLQNNGQRQTYADLYNAADGEIAEIHDSLFGGTAPTWKKIVQWASLHYQEMEFDRIDPVHKTQKNPPLNNPLMLFSGSNEEDYDMDSATLTACREQAQNRQTPTSAPSAQQAEQEANTEVAPSINDADLTRQIGSLPTDGSSSQREQGEQVNTPNTNSSPLSVPQVSQETNNNESVPEPVVPPKPKGRRQLHVMPNLEDLMAEPDVTSIKSTLLGLIKVAKELDLEGKEHESEEIHKIIRKYIKD